MQRTLLLKKVVYDFNLCMVGWLCFTSHRQRGHLEMAPPFTDPCEGHKARFLHRTNGKRTSDRHMAIKYSTAALSQLLNLYTFHVVVFFLQSVYLCHISQPLYTFHVFFLQSIYLCHISQPLYTFHVFFLQSVYLCHISQPLFTFHVVVFFLAERIFMPHQPTSVYVSCFFFAERIFMPHQPTSVYVSCCGFFFAEHTHSTSVRTDRCSLYPSLRMLWLVQGFRGTHAKSTR